MRPAEEHLSDPWGDHGPPAAPPPPGSTAWVQSVPPPAAVCVDRWMHTRHGLQDILNVLDGHAGLPPRGSERAGRARAALVEALEVFAAFVWEDAA